MRDETPPSSSATPPTTDATHLRTAWHPLFIGMLEQLLPPDLWRVTAEYSLTRESRRIDAVVLRRVAQAEDWHPTYLRSVLDGLRAHNVVHFKGATDALEGVDALQVISYACAYMMLEGLDDPANVALRVVAPVLTPRFRAQLAKLGGSLYETPMRGVHDGMVSNFALRVVETIVAWPHPHEHLLYSVSPECITHPERVRAFDDTERRLFYHLAQGIAQLTHDPKWKTLMKDATVVDAATEKALRDLFAVLSPEFKASLFTPEELAAHLKPEQRLAGLKPEQRLAGLKAEERLAGLDPVQTVLALPDAVLRGLSEDYLATLPDDVRATVRSRLGR